MKRGIFARSFLIALAAAGVGLCSHFAQGQATDGNIVGTVVDSQGAAVVGALVSAINIATNTAATTKTNDSGEYRLEHLLVGTYRISAKMTGFKTTIEETEVHLNTTGTLNLTLSPGALGETVEVSGAAPIIDTTTAQLQVTYEDKQLADLPTTGLGVSPATGQNLGVLNLSLLEAGVASTGGLGAGTGPSVGGQRPRDNNYTIEGVDNNDKGVTGPLVYVPADAVANFTVLQNQFNSEFGHSNGGQFNIVVKSGTNSFHGLVYEYFQNRNLNAIDQDVVNSTLAGHTPANPRFDNNRFGGQIGGPIIKDKLFFFVNYEYGVQGLAAVPGAPILAPTTAGYSTLLALPGVSAANVNALQHYAVAPTATATLCAGSSANPCPAANSIAVGTLPISAPNYTNFKALTTSMDYNLSTSDQNPWTLHLQREHRPGRRGAAARVLHAFGSALSSCESERIPYVFGSHRQRISSRVHKNRFQRNRQQSEVPANARCLSQYHHHGTGRAQRGSRPERTTVRSAEPLSGHRQCELGKRKSHVEIRR